MRMHPCTFAIVFPIVSLIPWSSLVGLRCMVTRLVKRVDNLSGPSERTDIVAYCSPCWPFRFWSIASPRRRRRPKDRPIDRNLLLAILFFSSRYLPVFLLTYPLDRCASQTNVARNDGPGSTYAGATVNDHGSVSNLRCQKFLQVGDDGVRVHRYSVIGPCRVMQMFDLVFKARFKRADSYVEISSDSSLES